MRVQQTIPILALVATALAAPHHGRWGRYGNGNGNGRPGKWRGQAHSQQQQQQESASTGSQQEHGAGEVIVVYVDQNGNRLEGYTPPKPKPVVVTTTAAAAPQPVKTETPEVDNSDDDSGNAGNYPGNTNNHYSGNTDPEPGNTDNPPDNSNNYSGGSGSEYIKTINSWRSKLAKPLGPLSWDESLASNAVQTASLWSKQGHHLYSGSWSQVMAPGNPDNFESVFVGGWLCERHELFAGKECATWEQGWDHSSGDKLHADILTGDSKTIGCGFAAGTWICDLA